MPLQPLLLTPSSTPRTSGFEAHKSFIRSAAAGVMVNGAGSARPRFVFDVGGAVAATAGRVLNARSASRALKGARAPGEPSAVTGVGRADLVLNGAAPPGAALASAAGASRLIGGAERRAARAAVRANIYRIRECFGAPRPVVVFIGWPEEGSDAVAVEHASGLKDTLAIATAVGNPPPPRPPVPRPRRDAAAAPEEAFP